ncbi:hypothetical protein [Streptomyces sp. NPDC003857]
MDERKERAPRDGTRAPLVAAVSLTPVQEAYGRITTHALRCDDCRDVDQHCDVAEQLWRTYQALTDGAFRRLEG